MAFLDIACSVSISSIKTKHLLVTLINKLSLLLSILAALELLLLAFSARMIVGSAGLLVQVWCAVWPAPDGERVDGAGEPGVQHVLVLLQLQLFPPTPWNICALFSTHWVHLFKFAPSHLKFFPETWYRYPSKA